MTDVVVVVTVRYNYCVFWFVYFEKWGSIIVSSVQNRAFRTEIMIKCILLVSHYFSCKI